MSETDKTFRDELLDMEKPSLGSKEEYERQVQAMVEKKVDYFWRVVFGALAGVGLLVALPFAEVALSRGGGFLGFFAHAVTILGLAVALAWAVLTGWVAIRGKLNLRTGPARMAALGIALGFFCVVLFLFVYIIPIMREAPTDWRSIFGIQLSLIGFSFLVIVGLCVVLSVLYRTQFKTREKLLEIEYRIAELAEKMGGKSEK